MLGTEVLFTSAYYPQTDGQVERVHCTIEQTLMCLLIELNLEQNRWVEVVPFVEFAINASVQDSSGLSPQHLVFGQVLWAPVDLVDDLHLIKAAQSWVSGVKDLGFPELRIWQSKLK